MNNIFKSTCTILFLSTFSLSSHAQSNRLDLDTFLSMVKQNDPEYRELNLELEKGKYTVDQGLPSRSILLDIENKNGFGNDGKSTKQISTTLSKEILESGTTLSASHTVSDDPNQNVKLTELRLEQPLFKNFLGVNLRLQKSSLENQQEIQKLKAIESIEFFLGEKIKLYLNFTHISSDVKISTQLYEESKKLYKFVLEKLRKGAANQTDLKRVALQMLLREEELLAKKTEYESIMKQIVATSGVKGMDVRPEEAVLANKKYPFQVKEFDPYLYRKYKIALENKNSSDFEKQIASRGSYPSLSLVAGYNIDNSTRFSSTVNRDETVLGFNLSVPLGDTKSKAQSEISNIEYSKSESAVRKTSINLKVAYLNLKNLLEKSRKTLSLSEKKVNLMTEILKDDNRRYKVGKIDLDKIIEANNDYAQFQLQYSRSRIEFNKIYIDWLIFNDELVK